MSEMSFVTPEHFKKVLQTLDQTPLRSSAFKVEQPKHASLILSVSLIARPEFKAVLFFGDGKAASLEEAIAAGPARFQVCADFRPGIAAEHDRLTHIGFAYFLEVLGAWAERVHQQTSSMA